MKKVILLAGLALFIYLMVPAAAGASTTATVSGVVKDNQANVLTGITISAWQIDGSGYESTITGVDGSYTLELAAGNWSVDVPYNETDDYYNNEGPKTLELTASEVLTNENFSLLEADAEIHGILVDENGAPVTSLSGLGEAYPQGADLTGDFFRILTGQIENGEFTIKVSSGVLSSYYLNLNISNWGNYSTDHNLPVTVLADSTVDVEVVLYVNTATLTGHAYDATGAVISIPEYSNLGEVNAVDTAGNWRTTTINSNGSYSLTLRGGRTWDVGYWMRPDIGADYQYIPTEPRQNITFTGNETITHDLHFIKTNANNVVTGTVTKPDGQAIRGALIQANNNVFYNEGTEENNYSATAYTDADGLYTLYAPPSKYMVHVFIPEDQMGDYVQPEDVQIALLEGEQIPLDFVLQESAAVVSGLILDGSDVAVPYGNVWIYNDYGVSINKRFTDGAYSFNLSRVDEAIYPDRQNVWYIGATTCIINECYNTPTYTINLGLGDDFLARLETNLILSETNFRLPESQVVTFYNDEEKSISVYDTSVAGGSRELINLYIPANAISQTTPVEQVTVSVVPQAYFFHMRTAQPIGIGFTLKAYNSSDEEIDDFAGEVQIRFSYTDEQLQALGLDPTSATDEASILPSYIDEATGGYVYFPNVQQDLDNNTITVATTHFSDYILVASGNVDDPNLRRDENGNIIDQNGEIVLRQELTARHEAIVTVPAGTYSGWPEGSQVKIYKPTGELIRSFDIDEGNLVNGYNVAVGDLDGDEENEIIIAPMAGVAPKVLVYSQTGTKLYEFYAYDQNFRGGVSVAAGDVDKDGKDEIVTLPYSHGGSNCRIFGLRAGSIVPTTVNFLIFPEALHSGFSVAMPDFEGDGYDEIAVAPLAGGTAHIQVWGYRPNERIFRPVIAGLQAYGSLHVGINLTSGDVDGDDDDELITGVAHNGGPQVQIIYRQADGTLDFLRTGFYTFVPAYRSGISLATVDYNGDGAKEIAVVPLVAEQAISNDTDIIGTELEFAQPLLKVFNHQTGSSVNEFYAYQLDYVNGVNISSGLFW